MSAHVLPRALAPWAKQLDLFPRDLALSMAPLLPRIAGLLGGSGPVSSPEGDPDGFDGLDRRGSYERLLPSEWLLLSEVPDEFLRRVAMSEHAFLRLSRRLAPAGRDVVALFDAGPDQLGAPRIAHLAALVVLAARADKEQAAFSFGVLQDKRLTLHDGLSQEAVTAMLEIGSPRPAPEEVIEEYLDLPAVLSASERWLIGGEDLRPSSARQTTSALIVNEPVEIDARRLHITVLAAGASRERTADLELPEERAAVRLLRDPFEAQATPRLQAPKEGIHIGKGLVLAQNGRRLFLVSSGDNLVSIVIPSSSRMPVPKVATAPTPGGSRLCAVGYNGVGRVVMVSQGETGYYMCQLTQNCRRLSGEVHLYPMVTGTLFPRVTPRTPLGQIWISKHTGICFFDPGGHPIQIYMGPAFRAAQEDDARPPWQWTGPTPDAPPAPEGTEIAAIPRNAVTGDPISLLLLDRSRTRLERFKDQRSEVIARTSAPIRHVVASEEQRLVAYLTETGHVGVYSLREGTLLFSMDAGEAVNTASGDAK